MKSAKNNIISSNLFQVSLISVFLRLCSRVRSIISFAQRRGEKLKELRRLGFPRAFAQGLNRFFPLGILFSAKKNFFSWNFFLVFTRKMRGNGPSEMVCSGAGDRSYFYFHCLADGLSSPSKDAAAPGLRRWTRTKQAAPRQSLTLTPCPTRPLTLNFRSISSLIYFLAIREHAGMAVTKERYSEKF